MIQNNDNKIKENKYKILRMSLLLGNGDDKEETISNFEDAAREIDAMNDDVYKNDLQGKFYDTLTLEEEEKKLSVLVDYIGGRIDQRMSLLEDFSNVTGYELLNLPTIDYQNKLDEYKDRLFYIREYLNNVKNIEKLNKEIDDLDNELNKSYVNKAKDEDRNKKFEEELLNKYNSIIRTKKEFIDINIENADIKLSDIKLVVDDSKKSLDIFNKSFDTLNQAGISGEERDEYLSYVNNAKVAYYNNKELEYLVKLFIIVNNRESEYNKILEKRDSINNIVYDRISLRKKLNITTEDILETIYNLLEKQYDDISSQKENIDNIEYLNVEIANRKELVEELIEDNKKDEIVALLKEFCLIDSPEEEVVNETEEDKIEEFSNDIDKIDEDKDVEGEKDEVSVDGISDDIFENMEDSESKAVDKEVSPVEEEVGGNKEDFVSESSNNDVVEVQENQIIEVSDASNIDVKKAIEKSNNVMKRVGEMLGVKVDKVVKEDNTLETVQEKIKEEDKALESVQEDVEGKSADNVVENSEEEKKEEVNTDSVVVENENVSSNSSEDKVDEFDFNENIFMNNNFDADPETSNVVEGNKETSVAENPLFNSDIANKTIDDVMADAKANDTGVDNDFWFSQEDTPVDLSSLPDIASEESNNNTFFGSSNNIPNLDFPSLDVPGVGADKNEEVTE